MEPRLFDRTIKGMEKIYEKGYKINYVESEDSEPGTECFETFECKNNILKKTNTFLNKEIC